MVRLFRFGLRLYPGDFRRAFGEAMVAAFVEAWAGLPAPRRAGFIVRECGGMAAGIMREWLATATAAPFERQMTFRDPSLMRPPGMTRHEWASRL